MIPGLYQYTEDAVSLASGTCGYAFGHFFLDHAGTAVSAEDDFLAAESVARLSRALEQQLSPMENEVLRLHISGFRYADIASRLNKSPKAVDNALQRIRKKLTLLFE